MGFADLHLHSIYSLDASCSIETILTQAQRRHVDVIAITDHNAMDGVIEALTLMKKYDTKVIPGMEISTAQGHLLAYEITRTIPRGLSLEESVLRVHEQGGFCIVPHPMAWGIDAVRRPVLQAALENATIGETILGIEIINGGLSRRNYRAIGVARQFGLAPVGSSDGHNLDAIGRVVTHFEGTTVHDLKAALRERKTTARWHHRTFDPLFYATHLTYRLLRSAGYGVGVNSENHQMQLARVAALQK